MFQYDSGTGPLGGTGQAFIMDFGRTQAQITAFFQQQGRPLAFGWSADGVRVAVDARSAAAVTTMVTTGDARTDNTILLARAVQHQVTADQFNQLREGGFFTWPALDNWNVGALNRLTADNPYLNIAVLSVPTHSFATWGAVGRDDRLKVLFQALRIAFATWSADYRADSVYVFAAPEYYFGGTTSHFMTDDDATLVTNAFTGKLRYLPDNFVVIPGSVGRRRRIVGQAAYDYYQNHLLSRTALGQEMQAHHLHKDEINSQESLWGHEPTMVQGNTQQVAYVYSNTATIFNGRGAPATYTKRYESDPDGGSPDRTVAQNADGYFDIGPGAFETAVNGLPIRLEICSDSSYESIRDSAYTGLHVVIASNFGQVVEGSIHGQVYAHVDSLNASVSAQSTATVATTEDAASGRTFNDIAAQRTATVTAGTAACTLTFHQRRLPG